MMSRWKQILMLAVPSIVSFATVTLTGTINLIMVGQMGALIIAAVGVSNIIMYNIWALFAGIGHTVNYLVAQNYGANDMNKGVQRTYLALYLCLIVSVLVSIAAMTAPRTILHWMGGTPELIDAGENYLRIRFFAMIFSLFVFVLHGFLRGIGDTKTPMVLTFIGNGVMIFFTYTLTYGHLGFPNIGLPGAAWAIGIGEAIQFIGCMYVYFIKLNPKYRTRVKVKFDRAESKLILFESGKLGIQEFAMSISMFVFTMFVTRLGTHALAANEVSLNVMSFGFMPAFAFGATATILVGQQVGRSNPLLARRIGTDTAILGSLFLLALGAVEFVLADPLARIYTDDEQVYELTAYLIQISAFLQIFDGLLNFYAGGLRGIGDTTFLLRTSSVLSLFLFVPLSYTLIFIFDFGSIGAWLSLYTYLTVFALAVLIRFYRTDWLKVRLKSAESH